jgi:peptidoglycan/LPS O-acetylase OafA/YrhL
MQRVKELDSIRGLAAIAIVVYHLWLIKISVLGAAVDLFFVLSGYLITSILLSNPPSERFLFSFYIRRGLRIWPIYYVALAALVLLNPYLADPGPLDALPYYLTFSQNVSHYWSGDGLPFIPAFRHTWSLAVEEQFYIIWPALLMVLGRRGLTRAALVFVGLALAMRALGFNRWVLATNCDGLALGSLLAGLLSGRSPELARSLKAPFRVVGLAAALYWAGSAGLVRLFQVAADGDLYAVVTSSRVLGLNLVFFAIVGLSVLHAGHRWLGVLRDRRLVYLGQISYGLYLYHHIVFVLWDDFAAKHRLGSHIGYDLLKLAGSFAIAGLSYRYIERPILSLKDRFRYQAPDQGPRKLTGDLIPVIGVETR